VTHIAVRCPNVRRCIRVFIVGLLLLVACTGLARTKIKDILDHPRDYDGRTVVILGEAKESTNLPVIRYFAVNGERGKTTGSMLE
jgi:hypothetical protein